MLVVLRIIVGSVVGFLLIMGLVLPLVITDRTGTPGSLWLAIVLLAGGAAAGLLQTVGFRTPSTAPGAPPDEARQQALAAFQAGTVRRVTMAEAPAIVALALAFAAPEGGYVLYLLGAVISLALLILYVWPSDANIARTQRNLERDGGQTDLAAALGR